MTQDTLTYVAVSHESYSKLLAACNGDSDLAREKLEYCIACYCEANAAIREAYKQEGCDAA